MLQFEELKQKLQGLLPSLNDLEDALGLKAMRNEIEELDMKASEPEFWDDMEKSQKVLQRSAHLKNKIEAYEKLRSQWDDAVALCDLANEEGDLSLLPEAEKEVKQFENELEQQRLQTLLTGEYDARNAILTFHAGAGGTEAQDWAEMLYRMYTRWGERHNFKVKLLDYLDGEEAGLKSASVLIEGENAYGFLKGENGVHRLVRISPFDASGRRHTSFASLEVMPEIDDTVKVEIDPADIKMDVYRASGAGGQKVNKT
ncbi:MAG TPA: peptide chain release factor 2, partial [Ruminococcaceae bacterium]|nr:peptide chain release factor 2 [Oscillospiraceae bacterium]